MGRVRWGVDAWLKVIHLEPYTSCSTDDLGKCMCNCNVILCVVLLHSEKEGDKQQQ